MVLSDTIYTGYISCVHMHFKFVFTIVGKCIFFVSLFKVQTFWKFQ